MKNQPFRMLEEFWPYYVREHRQAGTRWLHFIGNTNLLIWLFVAMVRWNLWIVLWAVVSSYAIAWIGHFFVEHNIPATFRYPLKSALCDMLMYYKMWRGEMNAEVRKYVDDGDAPKAVDENMNTNVDPQVKPQERSDFWRRQFSSTTTDPQIVFDIVMGVIAPIFCLIADPIVFRGDSCNRPLLGSLAPFGYVSVALGSLTLTIWLIVGSRISRGLGFIAGVFFAGAACALIVGIIMLPYSVLGLLLVVGALGFIPFLTAFVYLRNGVRAVRRARLQHPLKSRSLLFGAVLMGTLIIFAIPAFVQWQSPLLFPQWQAAPQYSCPNQ